MNKKLRGDYLIFVAIIVILIAIVLCIVFHTQIEDMISGLSAVANRETILDSFIKEPVKRNLN